MTGVVDERSQRIARRFEWPMVAAALLTIPMLVIEESSFGEPWNAIGVALNWITWLAFLAEVVTMLMIVPDRRKWIRTHPIEVFVTVTTPPFLPATLQALRVLRLLRVARVFRVHALRRLLSLDGLRYAALMVLLVVVAGGTAFAAIEGNGLSAWDGVWFATETVTTVGYGDIIPSTSGGRAIAMGIMFVGVGFVALLTAYVADRFIERGGDDPAEVTIHDVQTQVLAELKEIRKRLDRLEGGSG